MDGHELKRTLRVHEKIARAYADDRFPVQRAGRYPDLRMLVITTLWVIDIDRPARGQEWKRICEILHLDDYRFWRVIEDDAPRWEPPDAGPTIGPCEAPMIRRAGPCGQRGSISFRVTDPRDGTWRMASYCSRHEEYSREVQRAEAVRRKAGGIPEPVPNTGGLLPCYIGWDWEWAYSTARPGWKVPAVGLCADHWPVLAKVESLKPPHLELLAGEGGGKAAAPLPGDERPAPVLRLVPDA